MCKSSANPKSGTVFEVETEESFFLGEIVELDEVQSNSKIPWTATISVNGKPLLFKVDSGGGADVTVIPRHNFLELSQARLQPTTRVLLGPCKYRMNCKGVFRARLTNERKSIEEDIYVVEDLARPLLGRNAAANLKLISRVCELTSDDYKAKVMHVYARLFTGLEKMEKEYTIKLKDGSNPSPCQCQGKYQCYFMLRPYHTLSNQRNGVRQW